MPEPIHWVSDAPTSLHGNGAGSFERTTRIPREVTCDLCLELMAAIVRGLAAGAEFEAGMARLDRIGREFGDSR